MAEHDKSVLSDREMELIGRALDDLPGPCRMAFRLVKFHGLSTTEAAAQLNLPPRQVRRYVARALAHCLVALDSEGSAQEIGRKPQ